MTNINIEEVKPGMTVRIFQKVPAFDKAKSKKTKDSDKEKTQQIEGLVIARKHGKEAGATITIRRTASEVGVEWVIPIASPHIKKVELISAARVRRAKMYFLRDKSKKEIRAKLKERVK